MPKTADIKPLPKKRRDEIEEMTGIPFAGELGEQLLRGIDDMLRTGMRRVATVGVSLGPVPDEVYKAVKTALAQW